MYSTIVAAVDGSEESLAALRHARGIAECYGSRLILVHAYPRTSDLRDFEQYDRLMSQRKKEGAEILANARRHLKAVPFEVEEDLLEGPASTAVLSAAEAHKADLIVLGTRGMGAFKGLLMGSVGTRVVHYAACPVMIVR
jgi:nucleotide-binding universal stress UspA family protein